MDFPISAPTMLTGNTNVMNLIAKGKKYTLNDNTNKEAAIATRHPIPIACQFVKSFSSIAFPDEFTRKKLRHTEIAQCLSQLKFYFDHQSRLPNGWRYPLVGGTRQHHFAGTNFKPRKLPENAQTPTSRVHAGLGAFCLLQENPPSDFLIIEI